MIRTVLLDAYGTLLDTGTGSIDATQAILAQAGSSLDPAAFYAAWKQLHHRHFAQQTAFVSEAETYVLDLEKLYAQHGIDRDARADIGPMWSVLGTRVTYPEVAAAIRALRQRYTVAVASISDETPLLQDLSRGGIDVDGVYCSESMQVYKPRPQFYHRVLESLHCPPEQAVYVGDSPLEDIQGPQRVGMKAVWIDRKGRQLPEGVHPDAVIHRMDELLPWLEQQ